MKSNHIPVLLNEIIDYLKIESDKNYIDATVGLGGHTKEILKRNGPKGKVLCIDQDKESLEEARKNLASFGKRCIFILANFRDLHKIASASGFKEIDGILYDLGISSKQLEEGKRGFSFQKEGFLDMRMDSANLITAGDLVNNLSEKKLENLFKKYGEERFSRKIAKEIVEERKQKKIETTESLRKIIEKTIPKKEQVRLKINPATKVFLALRIAVNQELDSLYETLPQAQNILKEGGRLAIISFHSLEDRIVKEFFREKSSDCICPKEFPICICGHKAKLKIITKKPVVPKENEVERNPRSRSAKLRVAEKI